MSQKIIIPKGTIDSTQHTVIEIPNYLHKAPTVVVAIPKTAHPATLQEAWDVEDYNSYAAEGNVEQNETTWEHDCEAPEATNETEYFPDQQEQYSEQQYPSQQYQEQQYQEQQYQEQQYQEQQYQEQQYQQQQYQEQQYQQQQYREQNYPERQYQYPPAPTSEGADIGEAQQQADDQERVYENSVEETVAQPTRTSKYYDQYSENMNRRMFNKKRELLKLRAERRRMLEGDTGTYETTPQAGEGEESASDMSEVPEDMRGYQPSYTSDQRTTNVAPQLQNQRHTCRAGRPVYQQWPQGAQGYPEAQYARQPRSQRDSTRNPRRQTDVGPMDFTKEDIRQYQKARRKLLFNIPKN